MMAENVVENKELDKVKSVKAQSYSKGILVELFTLDVRGGNSSGYNDAEMEINKRLVNIQNNGGKIVNVATQVKDSGKETILIMYKDTLPTIEDKEVVEEPTDEIQ